MDPETSHLSSALSGVRLWRDKGRNSWLNNCHNPHQAHTLHCLRHKCDKSGVKCDLTWHVTCSCIKAHCPISYSSIKIPLWRRDRDGSRHPCHQGLPRPYNVTKHKALKTSFAAAVDTSCCCCCYCCWPDLGGAQWLMHTRVQVAETRFLLLLPGSWYNGRVSIIFWAQHFSGCYPDNN